MILNWVRL